MTQTERKIYTLATHNEFDQVVPFGPAMGLEAARRAQKKLDMMGHPVMIVNTESLED